MAKPPDTTAPLPIPSPSSSPQKKRSASSPLSNSLEEQRDSVLPLAVGGAATTTSTMKQVVLPSRKRVVAGTTAAALPSMPAVSVSSSTARDVAPSLTVTAISEQSGTAEVADGSGSNSVKKWGSIEQLQAAQSGFGSEMGKDSQWSMVERGTYCM